jgi:hypothetical protein
MSSKSQLNKVCGYIAICYKCLSILKEIFFIIFSLDEENRILHTDMNGPAISDQGTGKLSIEKDEHGKLSAKKI